MKGLNEIKAANKQATVDAYQKAQASGNVALAQRIHEAYVENYGDVIELLGVTLHFAGHPVTLPRAKTQAERDAQIEQCEFFYGPLDSYQDGVLREDALTQADGSDND